jgi:hypothetical protein
MMVESKWTIEPRRYRGGTRGASEPLVNLGNSHLPIHLLFNIFVNLSQAVLFNIVISTWRRNHDEAHTYSQ